MRLVTVALALGIAWSTEVQAQSLLVGGRIGRMSAMQHLSEPVLDYDRRVGVNASLGATFEIWSWFAVQIEGSYAQKGARQDSSYEMRLDYLEFPLLARIATPVAFHGLRPFLDRGTAPSVELRCSGYTSGYWTAVLTSAGQRVPLDCDGQRKRLADIGQVRGGGLLFDRGQMQWSVELRRTRGQDISGYSCCRLQNDVTSILIGVSRNLR